MFKLYDFMTCFLSGSGFLLRCGYDKGIWFLCVLLFEPVHEISNRIAVACLKDKFMHIACLKNDFMHIGYAHWMSKE